MSELISKATWIACPAHMEVPIITRTFLCDKPTAGRIQITGLGYFVLFVNGERVSSDVFTPALTDYEYRDRTKWAYPITDFGAHRIQYLEYDISSLLKNGENKLEIRLGPGFYRQKERICEGDMSFGDELKALYAMVITSAAGETVYLSDGSETCAPSEVVYSNLFMGETHDASRIGKGKSEKVHTLPAPDTVLVRQTCTPDRVVEVITPVRIGGKDGKDVYDIGINTTFQVVLTAKGKKGDKVVLRVGEEKKSDDEIDPKSTGVECITSSGVPQIQSDTFLLDGKERTFVTEFVWHGGRYIEAAGPVKELKVNVVHTDAAITSEFTSSNTALNWLYMAYINSQLTNLHGCIPSDCPHRERLGYTGDGQCCARTAMLTLDMKDVYPKWIRDIEDCQDITSGHIQHTAPHMGGGGGPGGWGCGMVIVPDEYDVHYDDIDLLREAYPFMKDWMKYLRSHSEDGIVVREEKGGWCLGDWAALYPLRIPVPYVNTCYLLDSLKRMSRAAERLGYTADKKAWDLYYERVKRVMVDRYYDKATGSFCGGVNGADAYAIWCGIADDKRTLKNLVKRYGREFDHFDTGFLGSELLIKVLLENHCPDVAFRLLSSEKLGSYAWMMNHGATTVWETYDGGCSHNHPMFGAPVRHFFDGFLGINQEEGELGYKSLVIRPEMPKALDECAGSVTLPCGKVSVKWTKKDGRGTLTVTVPENVPARLVFGGESKPLSGGTNEIKF